MKRLMIPFIDANIMDVTVTAWHKTIGDPVQAGEVVAELTTDKAVFDLESPADGRLLEIFAGIKSVVPIGYVVASIGSPGETDEGIADENERLMTAYRQRNAVPSPVPAEPERKPDRSPAGEAPAAVSSSTERIRATPKVRRLAREHGLDLAEIRRQTGADILTEAVLAPFLSREA